MTTYNVNGWQKKTEFFSLFYSHFSTSNPPKWNGSSVPLTDLKHQQRSVIYWAAISRKEWWWKMLYCFLTRSTIGMLAAICCHWLFLWYWGYGAGVVKQWQNNSLADYLDARSQTQVLISITVCLTGSQHIHFLLIRGCVHITFSNVTCR